MQRYEIIKKCNCSVSQWSGGTTTQVYIYPKGSDYAKRNFDFRISWAKVSLPQSDFTSLVGYNRYIMPLEGSMHLEHTGHHSITLKPFEQDYFKGEWSTKSTGSCTDFNLMLKEGYGGAIKCLAADRPFTLRAQHFTGVFIAAEDVEVSITEMGEPDYIESLQRLDFIYFPQNLQAKDYQIVIKSKNNQEVTVALTVEAFKE